MSIVLVFAVLEGIPPLPYDSYSYPCLSLNCFVLSRVSRVVVLSLAVMKLFTFLLISLMVLPSFLPSPFHPRLMPFQGKSRTFCRCLPFISLMKHKHSWVGGVWLFG